MDTTECVPSQLTVSTNFYSFSLLNLYFSYTPKTGHIVYTMTSIQ